MAGTLRAGAEGSAYHIALAETNQIVTGSGIVKGVFHVATGTSFVLNLYDSATTTENQLYAATSVAGTFHEIEMPFQAGLRAVTTGTPGRFVLSFE